MNTSIACRRRLQPAFWITTAIAMMVTGLLLTRPASADDHNTLAEVPFELRVDLAKAYQSTIGDTIMRYVREAKPNADELMDGLVETLGLDPRTAVSTLVLRGEGMNCYDLQLIADLGETTGKLEGWMLGLPGYESEELDSETLLHSFLMDDDFEEEDAFEIREMEEELEVLQRELESLEREARDADAAEREQLRIELEELIEERDELREEIGEALEEREEDFEDEASRVFVALPESNGRYMLVATLDGDATVELAEEVREGESLLDEEDALQGDEMLRVSMADLAEHNLPRNAPGSAVLESIAGLAMTLSSGENVTANLVMETASPARARQVTQLLQGLIALTQLAAMEQPEVQELANLLQDVKIMQLSGENSGVSASFSGSHVEFEKWVEWFVEQAN